MKTKKEGIFSGIVHQKCPNCGEGHVFEKGSMLQLPKMKEDDDEIRKLNTLDKNECTKYLNTDDYKLAAVDPGKIRVVSIIDEKNNFYKYSACRRRHRPAAARSRNSASRRR